MKRIIRHVRRYGLSRRSICALKRIAKQLLKDKYGLKKHCSKDIQSPEPVQIVVLQHRIQPSNAVLTFLQDRAIYNLRHSREIRWHGEDNCSEKGYKDDKAYHIPTHEKRRVERTFR
jgi:hypothetical protein